MASVPRVVALILAAVAAIAVLASVATPSATDADPIKIDTVTLNNGVVMPAISLGTWQYSKEEAAQAVTRGFANGFNHIDEAWNYGNQAGIYHVLPKDRESFFMTTKVPDPALDGNAYAKTRAWMATDLDDLHLDYVDLMLLHFPVCTSWSNCPGEKVDDPKAKCKAAQEQWRAAEDFYHAGKAKAIGVSNYACSHLKCILETATVIPAVNQVYYHVGHGPEAGGLKAFCDAQGITMQSYSPLGNGDASVLENELAISIGKKHGRSAAAVALRWAWQNGVPLSTKSTKDAHQQEALEIFTWSLTEDEMEQLNVVTDDSGMTCGAADTGYAGKVTTWG